MLRTLKVENYALIEHLELELDNRLNILTGETGAGKSILLGALGLLLGNKNDSSAMKDATRNCVIEGTFNLAGLGLEPLFEEYDLEYEEEITLRRVITPQGKSRSFVGDLPTPLSVVKELSSRLVDIHSQHQNLILGSEAFRLRTVDTLSGSSEELAHYKKAYEEWITCRKEVARLREEAEAGARDEEWLRYQVEELQGAKLRAGELSELENEQLVLSNADRISETLGNLLQAFDEEETGVLPRLKEGVQSLRQLQPLYPDAEAWAQRLRSALEELKDLHGSAHAAFERVEADPERLERVDNRMALLYSLIQKHRAKDLDELIALSNRYAERLRTIEHSDEALRKAERALQMSTTTCRKAAEALHHKRTQGTQAIEEAILKCLSELGMSETAFKIEITLHEEFTPTGADSVAFLFSANRNMKLQSIERIASGGELSRVMLALKALLAERIALPTILFDEIDTGVSGRIADAMGGIISRLSERMQVIDITHLPQVASKGDCHFVVYKEEGHTHIRHLDKEAREEEIAKMLSGAEITPAALEQARILLHH